MVVGLIIPGLLVAFLGTMYYIIPMGTGERVSYLATIMLTEIMFLVIVTEIVPTSKTAPSVAYLFLQQTILLSVVTIIALILDKYQKILDTKVS
jgi:nicotinic acetylcholine receptor alpha-1